MLKVYLTTLKGFPTTWIPEIKIVHHPVYKLCKYINNIRKGPGILNKLQKL